MISDHYERRRVASQPLRFGIVTHSFTIAAVVHCNSITTISRYPDPVRRVVDLLPEALCSVYGPLIYTYAYVGMVWYGVGWGGVMWCAMLCCGIVSIPILSVVLTRVVNTGTYLHARIQVP